MIAIFGFLVISQTALAQDKKIDQLEILYDQGYYQKVFRKSNKLLADTAYDYSGLPGYYKSLSLFRLSSDPRWFKRHRDAVSEAIVTYEKFVDHALYADYLHAHYYEVASLKSYLNKLGKSMQDLGYTQDADKLFAFSMDHMMSIKAKPDKHELIDNPELADVQAQEKGHLTIGPH